MSLRPLVRSAYHRGVGYFPLPVRRRVLYAVAHRRLLNLASPRSFNEKVNWRIVNDRRVLLAWTCDKLKMKRYVAALGTGVYVPRTIWSGRNLSELANLKLPPRWVLKPNHGSGAIYIGEEEDVSIGQLNNVARGWLENDRPPRVYGEWAYFQAESALLLEEWLGEGENVPTDYKFFVFDGRPRYVVVNRNRYGGVRAENIYTADWRPLPGTGGGWARGEPERRPAQLGEMLRIASVIGSGFDFIRVDLYSTSKGVVFGEVTPYPGGGLEPFKPRQFDLELGAAWSLPALG
jgi:hypothetical protein